MNRINLSRLVILTVAGLMFCTFTDYLYSATPTTINYQGRLRQSGQPITNPTQAVEFRIYNDPNAGTLIWRSGNDSVAVNIGIFSYQIGSQDGATVPYVSPRIFSAIDWSAGPYYLAISIGGTTGTELTPREPLQASAYAFYANKAAAFDGILPLANGGTNTNLSLSGAQGGIVYRGPSALVATSQLTGILVGNGSSGPTAITNNSTNWDSAYTLTSGATNINTGSTIVKRDSSGNFSAGTITANLTGNCSGSSGSCTGNAASATTAYYQ
jgi:hypothetical protein